MYNLYAECLTVDGHLFLSCELKEIDKYNIKLIGLIPSPTNIVVGKFPNISITGESRDTDRAKRNQHVPDSWLWLNVNNGLAEL